MADGLARQIAGLTGDIRNLGRRIPSYQRGVVANVSPPTVVMDRDVTATPRPVADVLVPGLAVGQRVEVRVIGSRRVITSIHPADSGPYVDWTPATISPGFEEYAPGHGPEYKVVPGGVVSVRGAVKPANTAVADAITTSSDQPIFTIPSAYHPVGGAAQYAASGLKQGSGSGYWHFRFVGGNFCASRYSGGTPSTSTWMPFSATYVI